MFRVFNKFIDGAKYVIQGSLLNDILASVRRYENMRAAPPLFIRDTADGKLLLLAAAAGVGVYRITATETGTGYYKARTQVRKSADYDPTTALDLTTYFQDYQSGTDDVTVQNIPESTGGSGSSLGVDGKTFVLGWMNGVTTASTGLPLVQCDVSANGGVCVKITGHASGGGKYNGTIEKGNPKPAASGNLAMPESYTAGATCLIINVEEDAAGSFWRIATGSYAVGIPAGMAADGTTPVIVIRGALGDLTSPLSLPPGGVSPNSTIWDWTTTGSAFTVDLVTDVWWDTTAGTLNKNYRTATFDARGTCRHVTAETTSVVDTAGACA